MEMSERSAAAFQLYKNQLESLAEKVDVSKLGVAVRILPGLQAKPGVLSLKSSESSKCSVYVISSWL